MLTMWLTVLTMQSTPALEMPKLSFQQGRGLVVESADGNFQLATHLRAQMLYSFGQINADTNEVEQQFQIRRARVAFTGHMLSKDITFKVELAISNRDMGSDAAVLNTPLLDWYFQLNHFRDFNLRLGVWKTSFNRERFLSSAQLQFVDRSIVNAEFNLDRNAGIELRSNDLGGLNRYRYMIGVQPGLGRRTVAKAFDTMLYNARFEYAPMGLFDDVVEGDLARHATPKLSLGIAYAFEHHAPNNRGTLGSKPSDGGSSNMHFAAFDAVFKFRGLSVMQEVLGRHGTRVDVPEGVPASLLNNAVRNGIGTMTQVGYLLPTLNIEPAFRYSYIKSLGSGSEIKDNHEIGGALSYYLWGHSIKWQADYIFAWNDGDMSAGKHVGRMQLQGAF